MVATDADTTSTSSDIPPSPYISLTPFLSPSSTSSPTTYTSFTSPVTRHRYFAALSGLSVLLFDDSLSILDAIDLSPHIQPTLPPLLPSSSPTTSSSSPPSSPSPLTCLAISPTQQLAVSTSTTTHLFTLIIHQQTPPSSVSTTSAASPSITSHLILGGEEEADTLHSYNPSLPHSFVASYFSSIPHPSPPTALAWRVTSPYHLAELVVTAPSFLSIFRYDTDSRVYIQTWTHTDQQSSPYPASSLPPPLRHPVSQPSSPTSPSPSPSTPSSLPSHLTLSPDGRALALLHHTPSTSLLLHNLDTATRHPYSLTHPTPLLSFSFCPATPPHDNLLSTLSTDGVIRFWRQNRVRPSTTISLSHLAPLTPQVVSEKGMSHSASVEWGAGGGTAGGGAPGGVGGGVGGGGGSGGLKAGGEGLAHTQSVPQSLSALKRGRGGKVEEEETAEEGEGADARVPRDVLIEAEVLQDQADVDWYVCGELELTSSASSAALTRNGYISCMWVMEHMKERSLMATTIAAATNANLSHFLQQATAATPAVLPPAMTSSYAAGLLHVPASPAPRLLTVDREGTIQLWYMRDILSTPRTNASPIPLLTLYHQLPALYLHPWLYSVNDVLPLPPSDEGVPDLVLRGWAGMEDGVCMRLTLVVRREADTAGAGGGGGGGGGSGGGGGKMRGWKGTFQIDRVVGGHLTFTPENPAEVVASPSSRHVASRGDGGEVLVWDCDESHLLLPRPGGEVEYGQQVVREGCAGVVWAGNRLVCVEDEWVDVWGWGDTRREWVRQGRGELDVGDGGGGKVVTADAVPAYTPAYAGHHFVVVCTATTLTLLSVPPPSVDPFAPTVLQQYKLPASHSSSPLTCAVLLPSPSPSPSSSSSERLLLAYGDEDGCVSLVSLTPSSPSLSLLTHFTAHSSTPITSIRAHSLCHLVTQSSSDSISVWEAVSHIFSYQLLHTLPPTTPPTATTVASYFSEHAVTAVRSSTSLSSLVKKSDERKWRRCMDVVDAGDGQVHVVTGDGYGQVQVYRPGAREGWEVDAFTPFPVGYALLSLVYSPHTLGVVVMGYEGARRLPLLRHLHLSTLLPSTSSHLPLYHPLVLEQDLLHGGLTRVKNILADLHAQLSDSASPTPTVVNTPIAHVLLKEDKGVGSGEEGVKPAAAASADSGQLSMGSFGGGFGGAGGVFGGGAFGGGGFGSFGAGSTAGSSSSLTPAITTYVRPTAEVQADPSSRELDALAAALKTKRVLPHLTPDEQLDLARVVSAVSLVLEQEKQLDEFAQRYAFAATLYRMRNPYPVVQESEDDKTAPPPYATLLAALPPMPTHAVAFAFHSSSVETLISLTTGAQAPLPPTGLSWDVCRQLGVGYWLKGAELSSVIESVARAQYVVNKNPNDCFLFYLALGKKQLLLGLMKQNSKYDAVFQFMSQDFSEQDNRESASKNAFRALTKRKYDLACGFFLLAGMVADAVNLCFRHMNDPQLAIVICRLVEGEQSVLLKKVVRQTMIPFAEEKQDVYIEYIALQLLRRNDESVYVLLSASGRQAESTFHPSTAALLRLVNHSKSRLYAVPKHLINAAERKAAAVYAQCGMGMLAMEEFPTEDVLPPPKQPKVPSTTSSPSSSSSLSALNSGQVSFGGGFGSGGFGGSSGGFGQANTGSGQVSMSGGFGQSSFSSGQVGMSSGFGSSANASSGQISMSGGFGGGGFGGGGGGFGQANSSTGAVAMTGGFGQASASSGQVAMTTGGFGQSTPTASASSGSLGGSFGSFGSFGSASPASGQVSMGGGFGQSGGSTPNAASGALGGSFGSFGSFGGAAATPKPAAPAAFNLGSFGSFGMSAASSPSASANAPVSAVAAAVEEEVSKAVDPSRSSYVDDAAHSLYLSSIRSAFTQQAAQLFLAARVPFTVVNAATTEPQGIIADILALQPLFPFHPTLAVQGLTAYTLIHRFHYAYLALSIQTHFSSSPILADGPHLLPQRIDQFLRRELETFASLLRHTSFHLISSHHWDQVASVYRQLIHWRTTLQQDGVGNKRAGGGQDEWNLLSCLIHSCLLLWAVREKDYATVMSTLEVRFAGQSVHEVLTLKEKEEQERKQREKEEEEKRMQEGDLSSLHLPPLPTADSIDLFASVRRHLHSLSQLLYLHSILRQHQQNFWATILEHDLHSPSASALASFNTSLLLALDTLAALTHRQLTTSMRRLAYHKADYEWTDPDDPSPREFPITDTLSPLLHPHFPYGSTLLSFLELESLLPRLGHEVERYFDCERGGGNAYFHEAKEVFRWGEKGEAPLCLCVCPTQPRYLVVGGGFGMREINVQSTLRFRERKGEDGAMTQEEERSWEKALHRYDRMEKDQGAEGGYTFPRPKALIAYALDGSMPQVKAASSALINSRVYEDFTGPSAKETAGGGTAAVDRDSPTVHLCPHPSLPVYLSITSNRVWLWHYGQAAPLAEFTPRTSAKAKQLDKGEHVLRVRFNPTGNKLAACTDMGKVIVWVFQWRSLGVPRPSAAKGEAAHALYAYDVFDAHSRACTDVCFLDGGNFIATTGDSSNGANVCTYSLLLPPEERLIVAFKTHDGSSSAGAGGGGGGGASLAYIPQAGLLVSGGQRGGLSVCDLSTKTVIRRLDTGKGGSGAKVHRLWYDVGSGLVYAGNTEGVLRVYDVRGGAAASWAVVCEWSEWYVKGGLMSSGWGVSEVVGSGLHVYVSGSDGTVRYVRKKRAAMTVQLPGKEEKKEKRRARPSTRR